MVKVIAKTEAELIVSIEAQTKRAFDSYNLRQIEDEREQRKRDSLSLMYGPNLYMPWEMAKLESDLCKSKIDFAFITDEAYKAMLAMTTDMLRNQQLTESYIQNYITAAAADILPVHIIRDMKAGSVIIATHKPVPGDIKAHFEQMRPIGVVIEYHQYLLATAPWPDPAKSKSPIPPKATAPAAAAPAAPATKTFPTNALKHGWTKPRGMR